MDDSLHHDAEYDEISSLSTSMREDQEFYLKISAEHNGFEFERNIETAIQMIQAHSGGKTATLSLCTPKRPSTSASARGRGRRVSLRPKAIKRQCRAVRRGGARGERAARRRAAGDEGGGRRGPNQRRRPRRRWWRVRGRSQSPNRCRSRFRSRCRNRSR